MNPDLWALIERLPIADTHEHLHEEANRIEPGDETRLNDIGVVFAPYMWADLHVAGMTTEDVQKALKLDTPPEEKWKLIRPYWELARNTGYGMCIRESFRLMFGEEDLTDENWRKINDAIKDQIRPGYYKKIIKDVANIDHCQVNTLEDPFFCETAHPDFLLQDISFIPLSNQPNPRVLSEASGLEINSLQDFLVGIDWVFETYGPRAVAVKSQSAYLRGLDYDIVPLDEADKVYREYAKANFELPPEKIKPLEDFLFLYCVEKATEYNLPVKLHTGYLTGAGYMPLGRLRNHAAQMCELCRKHPNARFVFMHMTYPYEHEAIAVAKHYKNAWIDMCWGTIINPVAAVRMLKEFLAAVPVNKVLTFGGDFTSVELVPGHAYMARKVVAQALSEMAEEGWLYKQDLPWMAERLLRTNALELFDVERCKKNGKGTASMTHAAPEGPLFAARAPRHRASSHARR